MGLKQISVSMPDVLFKASKDYSQEFGYKNIQEFILELLRDKVLLENIQRYQTIEAGMKVGKGVKRFTQKGAVDYIKKK
jgi:hypothetical protein